MKKLLFVGAINQGNKPLGGEEYKNQILVAFLKNRFRLSIEDTFYWKKKPMILINLLYKLIFNRYDKIIISASSDSTYKLIKFLNIFPTKIKKTTYLVIGGYFPQGVLINRYRNVYYQKLNKIVVQGELLRQDLIKAGLNQNVAVMPNFKIISPFKLNKNYHETSEEFRFVFLSRIDKIKGVELIFDAINLISQQQENNYNYVVDYYGSIDETFKATFFDLINKSPNCQYKGYLDILENPEVAYSILSTYNCLLFPTFWQGEGFPGVIIDAYICGLPVIASDWNMNSEVVIDSFNGILIPAKDAKALSNAMLFVMQNQDKIGLWSANALSCATKYDANKVLENVLLKII